MHSSITMQEASRSAKPWYRQLWPWLLMLGPFIVVVGGSYVMWVAFTRQDALVVDDYYRQGQAINQDLRRDRVAADRELAFKLQYDAASGALTGQILSHGLPYPHKIQLQLIHATLPEKDIKLVGQPGPDGTFVIPLPMLDAARWQVQVEGDQRDWRLGGGWSWPHQQKIEIMADPIPLD